MLYCIHRKDIGSVVKMNAGTKVVDQYGKTSIAISVWDNVVVTTAGTYHITKLSVK